MDNISLENKLVRTISEGVDCTGLLPFMFPNYCQREEIFFDKDNFVLYVGKYKSGLRKELEEGTKGFVAVCNSGMFDVDITDRETLLSIVYGKWGKSPSESVLKLSDGLTDFDFYSFVKTFWVSGKSKIDSSKRSIFNLYKTLGKQRYDILKCYFDLREDFSDSMIFSSLLSFIEKSLNPDTVASQNGTYLMLLENFRKDFGQNIVNIISTAYTMRCRNDADREYRTLWVLMQLGKGAMV